jgi:hypothetical protein
VGILVSGSSTGIARALKKGMHGTFTQKVMLCMIAAFLAASLFEWGKLFVEGADDALNGAYKSKAPVATTRR